MLATLWTYAASHWQVLAGSSALGGILIMAVTSLGPAVLAILKNVPSWGWEVLIGLVLILAFGVHERHVGAAGVQKKWDARRLPLSRPVTLQSTCGASKTRRRPLSKLIDLPLSRREVMMNSIKCALICAILSACVSAPPGATVSDLSERPKPVAPAAAMKAVPEAGYFQKKWTALLNR